MKNFSERLVFAMKQRNVTQVELAAAVGMTQQAVGHLCKKAGGSKKTYQIASYLRINPKWLADGIGQWDDLKTPYPAPHQHEGTNLMIKEEQTNIYKIPLISWRDAISWPDLDETERGKLVDMEVRTTHQASINAYAVVVLNDDYTNPPGQLSIPRGQRLIVDPGVKPEHGYIVIAKFEGQDSPAPMIYQVVGGTKYLKPIKTEYPPIPLDDTVKLCGTVIFGETNYLRTQPWP